MNNAQNNQVQAQAQAQAQVPAQAQAPAPVQGYGQQAPAQGYGQQAPASAPAPAPSANRAASVVSGFGRPPQRTNRPRIGRSKMLFSSIGWQTSRKGLRFVSIKATVAEPVEDAHGILYGQQGYSGYQPGAQVSFGIFAGDFFDREFAEFVSAVSGYTYEQIQAMPDEEFNALYGAVMPSQPGQMSAYAGRSLFEYSSKKYVKKDGTEGAFVNFDQHVTFKEISESTVLQGHHIPLVFGSVEQFQQMVQAETQS